VNEAIYLFNSNLILSYLSVIKSKKWTLFQDQKEFYLTAVIQLWTKLKPNTPLPAIDKLIWLIGVFEAGGTIKHEEIRMYFELKEYHIISELQTKWSLGSIIKQWNQKWFTLWKITNKNELFLFLNLFIGNLTIPKKQQELKTFLNWYNSIATKEKNYLSKAYSSTLIEWCMIQWLNWC